jgi:hypothetical protein
MMHTDSKFREMSGHEVQIVKRLLEPDFTGREQVLADILDAKVRSINEDETILEFQLPSYQRPKGTGQRTLPVEGMFMDEDGIPVYVYLFVDVNSRLFELEFCKVDGSRIKRFPESSDVQLIGP